MPNRPDSAATMPLASSQKPAKAMLASSAGLLALGGRGLARFHQQPLALGVGPRHDHRAAAVSIDDALELLGVDHFLLNQPASQSCQCLAPGIENMPRLDDRFVQNPLHFFI